MYDDFNALVGSKVNVVAKVGQIGINHVGVDMIVLKDVIVNGKKFRSHAHIKNSKRMDHLKRGDIITATAEPYLYIDVDTNKCDKIGLSSFRSVVVVGV